MNTKKVLLLMTARSNAHPQFNNTARFNTDFALLGRLRQYVLHFIPLYSIVYRANIAQSFPCHIHGILLRGTELAITRVNCIQKSQIEVGSGMNPYQWEM